LFAEKNRGKGNKGGPLNWTKSSWTIFSAQAGHSHAKSPPVSSAVVAVISTILSLDCRVMPIAGWLRGIVGVKQKRRAAKKQRYGYHERE
jgi:hypothetical protein